MTRQHHYQQEYPALWKAIDGAIRDAMNNHPEIEIPDHLRASITKRAVGIMLPIGRAALAAEMSGSSCFRGPDAGAAARPDSDSQLIVRAGQGAECVLAGGGIAPSPSTERKQQ